jgi:hypothetical protein
LVIDLGVDRDNLYETLLKNKRDFIIRMVGSRDLIFEGKAYRSLWLAYACRLTYENRVIKIIEGKEHLFNLRYGFMKVYLPDLKNPLTMVVIKGFGDKPMMLITSLKITSIEKDLWFIISST